MASRARRALRIAQRERSLVVFRADEPCLTYQCPTCQQATITVVTGGGTPPPAVRCMTTDGCTGHATTDYARTVPDLPAPWEWYHPDTAMTAAARAQGGPLWDHVKTGGMLLRHRRPFRTLVADLTAAAAQHTSPKETPPCP